MSRIIARRFHTVVLAACVSVGGSAVVAAPAHAGAPTNAASFYAPPASLPAGNGTLIKSERIQTLLNYSGNVSRIMYTSTDSAGKQIAVTGVYIEPWAKWSGGGPRPLVSYSFGTIGQGDQCAPSKMMQSSIVFNQGSLGVNYETGGINALLNKGVGVVITDYDGLGTPGVHTYMNRLDQAHAVLDAARVAPSVPGASVKADSKVATYGYSQGGGASGAAIELAPQYAPELKMTAGYVGAPPADLEATLDGIDGSSIAGVMGYFINGFAQAYPQVKPFLTANVNPAGQAALTKISGQCIADSVASYGFTQSKKWTKTGESLKAVMLRDPQVMSLVRQQKIGNAKPTAPVRVATGVYDDIVPHAQAKQLALNWCSKGANVTYAPISGANLGNKVGLNHVTPMLTDQAAARDWVVARLAGTATTSNCATAASLK